MKLMFGGRLVVFHRCTLTGFHAEGNTLSYRIHIKHAHMHNVTHLHHIPGVFHEAVGKLRNMHQAVLMHTQIDERAEV